MRRTSAGLPRPATRAAARALALALAVAGVLGVVAGCGYATAGRSGTPAAAATTGASSGVAPTPPSSTPASATGTGGQIGGDVTGETHIGAGQRGQVVTVQVGQRLVVTLGDGWTAPAAHTVAGDPEPPLQPLHTEQAVGYPSGPSTASFVAVRRGDALVSAQAVAAGQTFEVHVRVLPVPGTGAGPLPVPAPS